MFKVGDVWKNKRGEILRIIITGRRSDQYPLIGEHLLPNKINNYDSFTSEGHRYLGNPDNDGNLTIYLPPEEYPEYYI